MSKKEGNNDYVVLFKGVKLSKCEANSIGLGIIFGIAGILVAIFTPIAKVKFLAYVFIAVFSVLGYFLGIKLFRK